MQQRERASPKLILDINSIFCGNALKQHGGRYAQCLADSFKILLIVRKKASLQTRQMTLVHVSLFSQFRHGHAAFFAPGTYVGWLKGRLHARSLRPESKKKQLSNGAKTKAKGCALPS